MINIGGNMKHSREENNKKSKKDSSQMPKEAVSRKGDNVVNASQCETGQKDELKMNKDKDKENKKSKEVNK